MSREKAEWDDVDHAVTQVIIPIINTAGYSYRELARRSDGKMTYGRFFDLCSERHASIRLSEFVALCDICNADPREAFNLVLQKAEQNKNDRRAASLRQSKHPTGEDEPTPSGADDRKLREETI